MAIQQTLLDILVCPETKTALNFADHALLAKLNAAIAANTLQDRGGDAVTEPLDGGLVRADRQYLYPIRDDIPIMLIDKAIPLAQVA